MKIILNAATSIDGKIATVNGDTKISSVLDLKRVHGLRRETDVILVGISTVINDDPLLTIRYGMNKKGTKNPIRIIIDSKAWNPFSILPIFELKILPPFTVAIFSTFFASRNLVFFSTAL